MGVCCVLQNLGIYVVTTDITTLSKGVKKRVLTEAGPFRRCEGHLENLFGTTGRCGHQRPASLYQLNLQIGTRYRVDKQEEGVGVMNGEGRVVGLLVLELGIGRVGHVLHRFRHGLHQVALRLQLLVEKK